MDSANSGSMQSSSRGDEEYDSSGGPDHSSFPMASFSSTHQPLTAVSAAAFFADPNLSSSTGYDNLNFLNSIIIPPPLPNLPSSSTYHHYHDLHLDPVSDLNPSHTIPPASKVSAAGNLSSSTHVDAGVVIKNPKKRTRASRRAPTTVLTTDTTNFREMVQEFTGVPTQPFSTTAGRSYSSGNCFDNFRSTPRSSGHHLDSLHKIFSTAQKVQSSIPSKTSSSSLFPMINHNIVVDSTNIVTSTTSPTINFHSLPDLPLPRLPMTNRTEFPAFQSLMSQQHHLNHHQTTVSSLHECNTMNLGACRPDHHHAATTNGGDVSNQDHDQDRV